MESGLQVINFTVIGNTKARFHNRLNEINIMAITAGMEDLNEFLIYVNLSYNNLTDNSILALAKILQDAINLKELILKGCDINDISCAELSNAVLASNQLMYLDISHNNIGRDGAREFVQLLTKDDCKLEELYIGDNNLDHDAVIAFYNALNGQNNSLKKLDISRPNYNSIMQETTSHCHKMLRVNSCLEYLNLTKHKLRHDGI